MVSSSCWEMAPGIVGCRSELRYFHSACEGSEINYRINSITLVTTTVMREQKVIILELWSI
jgi:hypothetical protein